MSQDLAEIRMRVAALVSRMHEDSLIGPRELAALHSTTVGAIHQLRAKHPERLPPTAGVGGRQLRWHLGTAQKWLRDRATATSAASVSLAEAAKRNGRPRKA
jgi:predicted DNA-binding transcriptional regulator AlpA